MDTILLAAQLIGEEPRLAVVPQTAAFSSLNYYNNSFNPKNNFRQMV
jgi:hypothetical protein